MKTLIIILALSISAFATIYSVNTLDDTADGSCSDGSCSLRDAMLLSSDMDTINIEINGTITLSSHLPDINGTTLTIRGGSKDNLVIDANNLCRPFKIYQGHLTLSNLKIIDGNNSNEPLRDYPADNYQESEDHGGAIFLSRSGSLTLNKVDFSNNNAKIHGGAIHAKGSVFITECRFYNNKGGGYGGAIKNTGILEINSSNFTLNKSVVQGGALMISGLSSIKESNFLLNQSTKGAGIYIYFGDKTDTHAIIDSDFSSNIATEDGGAIYSKSALTLQRSLLLLNTAVRGAGIYTNATSLLDGNTTIINSTISHNTSSDDGAGIYMSNNTNNPVNISHTTIVNNNSENGNSGGISHQLGNLYIKNTILSNNHNSVGLFDCKSIVPDTFHSNGKNIFSLNSSVQPCTFSVDDIYTTQEQVGPILDNGGKTKTHALLEDAQANDTATCSNNLGIRVSEDQRGFRRAITQCDIGAYEETDLSSGLPAMFYLLLN